MSSEKDPPPDMTAPADWPSRRHGYNLENLSERQALFLKLHDAWRDTTEVVASDSRSFVDRHLKAALAHGWVANYRVAREAQHFPAAQLNLLHHEWRIFREGIGELPDDNGEFEHYIAYLNARNQLVLVYGNQHGGDSQPHLTPSRYWEHAICIPLDCLGVVLPFVFARPDEFPPNFYSRT